MALIHNTNSIVTNGLVLALDAANTKSYPGSGTTWNDLSGNGNTGTLTNGPTYSSTYGGSIVFDGSNDYSSHPYSSLLDLGTQFTISSFIKFNNLSTLSPIFAALNVNTGVFAEGYQFFYTTGTIYEMNTNTLRLQFGQNNWAWNIYASNGITITDNNWHFVSVTASNLNTSNPTITFYIDGNSITGTFWNQSSKAAIRYSSNINSPRVASIIFPSSPSYDGPYYFNGNIAQVSIYNRALSAAEVSQNYNALKSRYLIQYIDPYYPYVSLLLRNSFTDESPSPKTITTSGTASITTTAGQWKYSGSAFSLTKSTSSYIQAGVANDSAFDFGSGDFTIEAWINPSVVSGYNGVVGTQAGSFNAEGWSIYVSSGQLSFYVYSNTSNATFYITGGTITLNSYSHIAVTRSGSTIRSFINGTLVASGSLSGALVTTNAYSKFLRVGFESYTGYVYDYAGFIDDLRITKGVARYTANFTPPTTESSTGYYNI